MPVSESILLYLDEKTVPTVRDGACNLRCGSSWEDIWLILSLCSSSAVSSTPLLSFRDSSLYFGGKLHPYADCVCLVEVLASLHSVVKRCILGDIFNTYTCAHNLRHWSSACFVLQAMPLGVVPAKGQIVITDASQQGRRGIWKNLSERQVLTSASLKWCLCG